MRYAAYQSHLWNDLLRRLIRLKIEKPDRVPGREGTTFSGKSSARRPWPTLAPSKSPRPPPG